MIQESKSGRAGEPSASCGQSIFPENSHFQPTCDNHSCAIHSIFSFLTALLSLILVMSQHSSAAELPEIAANHVSHEIVLDAAYPAKEWKTAQPITFSSDWQGQNSDPALQTTVRALWSNDALYLRFVCRYRDLYVFSDSDPNGRREHLWDRDVVEAFLQPDPSREFFYKEFEVAPNAMWVDLDIFPGGRSDLKSGMKRSVYLDRKSQTWSAELAIPMNALADHFAPHSIWRVNFFRVEGKTEPRSYLAWQPTRTPQPNFHVPGAFGTLRFQP